MSRDPIGQGKAEVLKGTLDMLILKVVALGPIHGYAISQTIRQMSKDLFQVPEGSLYPALHRLEDLGWLQAKWEETETGRDAKFYSLTGAGKKRLSAEPVKWERLSEAVALILSTADRTSHERLAASPAPQTPHRKAARRGAAFSS